MTDRAADADAGVGHYVRDEPFDPYTIEALSPEQERFYLASQWQMMWWKLKRHRLAVISGISSSTSMTGSGMKLA